MKRRIAIGIAAILVGLAVVAFGVAYWAEQRVLTRMGCQGDLGLPVILPGRVHLRTVHLVCRRGTVDLESVELRGGLLELAEGHPSSVVARRGRVSYLLPSGSTGVGTGASGREIPSWQVEDIDVAVQGTAELGRAHVVRGQGSATELTIVLEAIATSSEHSPTFGATTLEASLVRDEHWRVSELVMDGLSVALSDSPSLREALAGPAASESGPRRSLLDRFAESAQVTISDARVVDHDGVSVSGLSVRASREGVDTVQCSGEGSPRGSGHLRWDLRVRPSSADAEGSVELERVPWSVFEAFLPDLPLQHTENTLLSGNLQLETADRRVDFSGTLSVAAMTVSHVRLAADPVVVDTAVSGAGHWNRDTHELVVDRGSVSLGRAQLNVSGRMMRDGDRYAANVDVTLPVTGCNAAVAAIPRGLLQEAGGWTLEGNISAHARLVVDSEHLDATQLALNVNDGCRFVGVPAMADINRFRAPFRHVVNEPDGSVFEMETGPGSAAWTSIYEVSPFLVHSVIAHEDAAFFRHSGFAPWAIRDALVRNLRERRYVLGASTITMQLVKNVFLRREKTLARKVQEVLLTWWLERSMTKEQILELYLNVIEYGPEVYGVRHAAMHYFGRTPAELTPAEAAYLAMILPNPPSFHEHFEAGAVPPSFARRVQRFVDTLRERGRIDDEAHALGVEELLELRFSRNGERVGPELRGSSASLPIQGFSGMPLVEWSEDAPPDDASEDTQNGDAWEESWP